MKMLKDLKIVGKNVVAFAATLTLFSGAFFSCSNSSNSGGDDEDNSYSVTEAIGVSDINIQIALDSKPEISAGATAKIYLGEQLVDEIKASGEKLYAIGAPKGEIKELNVDDQLLSVSGSDEDGWKLVVVPHSKENMMSKLTTASSYTVKFEGITPAVADYTFTTKGQQTISNRTINVGAATSDNFYTIQGALNFLKAVEAKGDWTINVAAGEYHELLSYNGEANVNIIGKKDGENLPHVYWRNSQVLNAAQRARQSFIWQGGNLTLENLFFENTTNRAKEGNTNVQAETLVFDVTKDLVVVGCKFYSYQDTLLLGNNGGRCWFYDCEIAGDVDFIWGTADVCLIENCKIICRADGVKNDAKIFASRTVATKTTIAKGFILANSEITVEEGCNAAYGRSSGADTQAAVFNNKFVQGAPNSALWGSPSDTVFYEANGEMAVGYKDYNNKLSDDSVVATSGRKAGTADMSERLYNREYNGRWTIFNRVYNKDTGAYEFASSIYDITTIAKKYNAPADDSINNFYTEPVYSKNVVGGKVVQLTNSTKGSSSGYTYESSDTNLATVDKNGKVSTVALADGTVKITVTNSNGKTDVVSIKVIPVQVDVTGVAVSNTESVDLYELKTVTATLSGKDGQEPTVQTLKWEATGNIKIVNPKDKVLVTELETEGNTVQIEGISTGTGTIKVTSVDNQSATASDEVTVTDVRNYNAIEAVAVNNKDVFGILNFQSGKTGIWHDIYVHAIYGSTDGKIAASGERIQARYGTFYIPVTDSCVIDMSCQMFSDAQHFATDFMDAEEVKPATSEGSEAVYKYHYKWEYDAEVDTAKVVSGADVKALFDAATKDTSRTLVGAEPDANAKYFAIHVPGGDRYISTIVITKDSTIHHTPAAATLTASFAEATKTLDLNGTTTVTQTATATSSDGATPAIAYESDCPTVATVDASTGAVTAVGIGEATITATASHSDESVAPKTATYKVRVNNSGTPAATYSIALDKNKGSAGDYGIFATTTADSSAAYHNAHGWRFASGDTLAVKVAGASKIKLGKCKYGCSLPTADNATKTATTTGDNAATDGVDTMDFIYSGSEAATVTFTFAGQAYIHSVSVEPYTPAAVTITVTDFADSSVELDLSGTTTATKTTTATASNGETPTIAYSSSCAAVATVDSSTGAVTAVGIGKATITAKASLEGAEDAVKTYEVVVKQSEATESETFDFRTGAIASSTSGNKTVFDFGILTGSAYYHGTTYGLQSSSSVSFKVAGSSTIYIPTMDYGYEGTLKNGETTLGSFSTQGTKNTATTLEAAKTANTVVFVRYTGTEATTLTLEGEGYLPLIWVEKYVQSAVTLSATDFTNAKETLDMNGTTTVTQTVTGSASDSSAVTVKYTSSKTAVATVDEDTGVVTAVSMGQTTITATVSKDGCEDVTKTYNVLVKDTATPTGSYEVDFNSGNVFTVYGNTLDFGKLKINPGSKNAYGLNNGHGAMFKEGNSVELVVPAGATVKVAGCQYNNATSITATVSAGTVDPASAVTMTGSSNSGASSCSVTHDFTVTEACTITLAFTGSTTYVAKIEVVKN